MPQITGAGTPSWELPPYGHDFTCYLCRVPFRIVPGDRFRILQDRDGENGVILVRCPGCNSEIGVEHPNMVAVVDCVIFVPYTEYERLIADARLADKFHEAMESIQEQEHLFNRLDADFGDLFEGIRRLLERRPEQQVIERREDRGREPEPRRPARRRRDPDEEWNPRGNYNPEVEERLAAAIVPDVQVGRRGGGGGSRAPITEGLRDD